jgi:hypothetical protein
MSDSDSIGNLSASAREQLAEKEARGAMFRGWAQIQAFRGEFFCPICRRMANALLPGLVDAVSSEGAVLALLLSSKHLQHFVHCLLCASFLSFLSFPS